MKPPSIRSMWRWSIAGTEWPRDNDGPPRCAFCGWEAIWESDAPDDTLFTIYKWRALWTVCRNHPNIYGIHPIDCLTGQKVHGIRIAPSRYRQWKRRADHNGRYWAFVLWRFYHHLRHWPLAVLDCMIYDLYQTYKSWRKRSYEDST